MILAGGRGERLYPLTRDRAKPAVPFGAIYRIIDFTLSNCLNSDIRRIYVLTQYKSTSLHRHIQFGWNILVQSSWENSSRSFRPSRESMNNGIRGRRMPFFKISIPSSRKDRISSSSFPEIISIRWITGR